MAAARGAAGEAEDASEAAAREIERGATEVKLYREAVGDAGARVLARAMERGGARLVTLDLCYVGIGPGGARALASAICVNSSIVALHLGGNELGDDGARFLAAALGNINELHVNAAEAARKHAEAERSVVRSELPTSFPRYRASQRPRRPMPEISVRKARAGQPEEPHSRLITLALFDNKITAEGARVLAAALMSNTSLTSLSLDSNMVRNEGARALSGMLDSNSTLTSMSLEGNRIEAGVLRALMERVQINALALDKNAWY
jgi:Ran GTPase-activating protein (RanGAP) involved in mRNA processing and transport